MAGGVFKIYADQFVIPIQIVLVTSAAIVVLANRCVVAMKTVGTVNFVKIPFVKLDVDSTHSVQISCLVLIRDVLIYVLNRLLVAQMPIVLSKDTLKRAFVQIIWLEIH